MKIAIVGTGAMGSLYAGLLGDAHHEVWAIDKRRDHVDAIVERGLRVSGASGDRTVRVNATDDPAEVGIVDLVVIATKAFDVRTAVTSVESMLGARTTVLPIQNGLGSSEVVGEIVGEDRVVVGVVGAFGSSVVAPGHVHHHGHGVLRLGEPNGPVSERVETIAAAWVAAGFNVRTYDDVPRMVWEKLICNVAFSGPCGALGFTIGEVLADPHAVRIATGCAREAYEVAIASGVALDIDDPESYVVEFGGRIPGARPSLLLDLDAGERCEIDVINGAIPPRAAVLGVDVPFNDVVTSLVKARESSLLTRPTPAADAHVPAVDAA